MFSLAYVILPFSDVPPADAIAASLERFQMGGRGDLPGEWITFDDETTHVEELYRADITFTKGDGLRTEGADSWYLEMRAIVAEMDRRGVSTWRVRFADVEPTLDSFAKRYLSRLEQHPITQGFGHWHNALGRWDWWDLGGRFDGVITRSRRDNRRTHSTINSGPSRGRDVLEQIEDALCDALDQEKSGPIDIAADNNIELVSSLIESLDHDESGRLPSVLVLPPGCLSDEGRWVRNWPEIGPMAALAWLGLPTNAQWPQIVRAAYERFHNHWAAGVAFHH